MDFSIACNVIDEGRQRDISYPNLIRDLSAIILTQLIFSVYKLQKHLPILCLVAGVNTSQLLKR